MKLPVLIAAVLLYAPSFFSQEENRVRTDDSINYKYNTLNKLLFQFDEFEFYRELTEQKKATGINSENAKLLFLSSLGISDKSAFDRNYDYTPRYLHSSLYKQYLDNIKFNPLKTALGMIQVGAAGYLAYRHIKKYMIKK